MPKPTTAIDGFRSKILAAFAKGHAAHEAEREALKRSPKRYRAGEGIDESCTLNDSHIGPIGENAAGN
jgi:hypothetical protein